MSVRNVGGDVELKRNLKNISILIRTLEILFVLPVGKVLKIPMFSDIMNRVMSKLFNVTFVIKYAQQNWLSNNIKYLIEKIDHLNVQSRDVLKVSRPNLN